MKTYKLLFVVSVFFLSSCSSLKLFTSEVKEDYQLNAYDIQRIQFYIDAPFTLHRIEENISRSLTDQHSLESKLSKYEEEVIIDTKTPGIALSYNEDIITVDFGEGIICQFTPQHYYYTNQTIYLLESINENILATKKDREEIWNNKKRIALKSVLWNGKNYEVIFIKEKKTDSINWPALLFDENILKDYKKETKKIKGKELK